MLNSKIWSFITSWSLIKTTQNFVQGLFSITFAKACHWGRGGGGGGERGRVKVLRDTILLQSFYTDSKSTRTWILVNISKLLYVNSLSLGPSGISEIATHSLVLAVLHCTSVCRSLPCAWIFRYFCLSSQQTQPLKIWIWLRLNYF